MFNSLQTSDPSLLPPWSSSMVEQQTYSPLVRSLSIYFIVKKWECEDRMTRDLLKTNQTKTQQKKKPTTNKTTPSASQLSASPSSPPLSTGLSLQADHVPEYHRSLSSHSLRSCNLLRPQCQNAALSIFVVCSLFFNIFLNGRDAQTGCYHYAHSHLAAFVVVLSRVRTKLKFNKL